MLRADFCVLPRGDEANPGRRLLDAVAAGCVPMIIGDTIRLPLAPLIAYKNFSVRVPESEFLRDPHAAVNEVLAAYHALLWPDLFIIGGGVTENWEQFGPLLVSRAEIVPAHFRNDAGIIGAAMAAAMISTPAAAG
jgi:hypothetical protein